MEVLCRPCCAPGAECFESGFVAVVVVVVVEEAEVEVVVVVVVVVVGVVAAVVLWGSIWFGRVR